MTWLAVAFGGALGALSRFALMLLLPANAPNFPWAIWIANVMGSVLLGLFYVLAMEKGMMPQTWRPFIAVGFLGALTTFSSFALDGILLWQQGQSVIAITYIVSTLVLCLVGTASTILLAQRFF